MTSAIFVSASIPAEPPLLAIGKFFQKEKGDLLSIFLKWETLLKVFLCN
ncbi:hypothetical protein HMPREF7215_1589 [Pyramidobacter piscolens W5455]|uniref:Uncharacterized protein n=1 Tax=Pyramidobacter piscolens W5455 TaxID=352165 RepID=A0ABM9ZX13_9BACT|nr:hypothetical protein HMPREF7215_1589 [Pyramidobacter piscolens W5455]